MKLIRNLVGKEVRVQWRDPCSFDISGPTIEFIMDRLRRGMKNLPPWEERGVILSVEDNVLVLSHGQSFENPLKDSMEGSVRIQGSLIPGDLIEQLTFLEPRGEGIGLEGETRDSSRP